MLETWHPQFPATPPHHSFCVQTLVWQVHPAVEMRVRVLQPSVTEGLRTIWFCFTYQGSCNLATTARGTLGKRQTPGQPSTATSCSKARTQDSGSTPT